MTEFEIGKIGEIYTLHIDDISCRNGTHTNTRSSVEIPIVREDITKLLEAITKVLGVMVDEYCG